MTTDQPDLFSVPTPDESRARRDAGMELSADNAGDDWHDYAVAFVRRYAMKNRTVFCDDIWEAGLAKPSSPRAFGMVMRAILAAGDVVYPEPIWFQPSSTNNRGRRPVYRSAWVGRLGGVPPELMTRTELLDALRNTVWNADESDDRRHGEDALHHDG